MRLEYKLTIEDPHNHYVKVKISGKKKSNQSKLCFFLPSWSPGSYLMREYSRHVCRFMSYGDSGDVLWFDQVDKGAWEIDWSKSKDKGDGFSICYEVYCHDFTVRSSFVDQDHAFIHGPSVFMGVEGEEIEPTLRVEFPALWSKISTGLTDISQKRDEFVYSASDYDSLIDTPLEIGCHYTNGFYLGGKEHEVAIYGVSPYMEKELMDDIEKVFTTVYETMGGGELPYSRYCLIVHMKLSSYGGLEHANSAVLHFCPRKIMEREARVQWLSLVAHEYFHCWNGKRIRPVELGPFDYRQENMTRMLWLVEGLTSFMDDLFVFRAEMCTLEEYLGFQTKNIKRYYDTFGKVLDSLYDSSFKAWIKLYRPDENLANTSISYYLKGGIVFWVLAAMLHHKGKSIDNLIHLLWQSYLDNPKVGINDGEFFTMVANLAGEDVAEEFAGMVQTTEDIDIEKYFNSVGLEFEWERTQDAWIGAKFSGKGGRLFIDSVTVNGPAYKGGLNAGDEIIAIDGTRALSGEGIEKCQWARVDELHTFMISRLGTIREVDVLMERSPRILKQINIGDLDQAMAFLVPQS